MLGSRLTVWRARVVLTFVVIALLGVPSLACAVELSAPWKVCFSPEGHCASVIISEIDAARSSIRVQAYGFTARDIADALVRAEARGVDVAVIVDRSQTSAHSTMLDNIVSGGIPLYIDSCCAIAHNKVMIIDEARVITGSYNFTAAAESKNAENLLVLNDPALARHYLDNWMEHRLGSARFLAR